MLCCINSPQYYFKPLSPTLSSRQQNYLKPQQVLSHPKLDQQIHSNSEERYFHGEIQKNARMEIKMYKTSEIDQICSGELGEKIMGRESLGEKVLCHGSVTHVSRERHGKNWRALLGRKFHLLGFWVANVNFVCFKTHPSFFSDFSCLKTLSWQNRVSHLPLGGLRG